jgi:hypothetical protein
LFVNKPSSLLFDSRRPIFQRIERLLCANSGRTLISLLKKHHEKMEQLKADVNPSNDQSLEG